MAISKNSRVGRERADTADNHGCLPKYNYSNGAGWKTSKKSKIGKLPADHAFGIKHKKRGRGF